MPGFLVCNLLLAAMGVVAGMDVVGMEAVVADAGVRRVAAAMALRRWM